MPLDERIQSEPASFDTLLISRIPNFSIFGKLARRDIVDREDELDVVGFRLLDERFDLLAAFLIKQRGANLYVFERLLERERHAAADDELVDFVEQVLNQLNLISDFGAS